MGKVMKRDGGLVEAMGGCRPPTPAPAAWVRPRVSPPLKSRVEGERPNGRLDVRPSRRPNASSDLDGALLGRDVLVKQRHLPEPPCPLGPCSGPMSRAP